MQTAPETWNALQLTSLSHTPVWLTATLAALLLGALALSLLASRGAPTRIRAGLFTLRALLSLAILFLLLEPGVRLLSTSKEPNRVVIAVDTSASMAVSDAGRTRMQRAASAAQALLDDLKNRDGLFVPELWFFDQGWRRAEQTELATLQTGTLPATGAETRLALPVTEVQPSAVAGDFPLGGIVIISDGADTTGLSPALSTELREKLAVTLTPPPTGARRAPPLHGVLVGADGAFKDIVLERAGSDEFAFVRNKMTVEVVVRHRGYAGLSIPLTLKEDGRVVATTEVVLSDEDQKNGAVHGSFTYEPTRAGKRLYTVTTPVLSDEAIAENNRIDFTVKLIRDRIRVLQVAGRPSWDERFLRRLLKENPSVDLISFFILRSTTDVTGASNRELSLIPFPTRELFTEQLHTFDVVIFQDFNYRPYQMGIYLENVKKYVEEGGGFLMVGGDLSFSDGEYEGTPIADVLPVRLLPGTGHIDTEPFKPLVTEAGKNHPITDLGDVAGSADGAAPLSGLPALEGINITGGLLPGAEALIGHPFLNGPDGPLPVVAVREVAKGRSMAITTDATWSWALPHLGGGGRGDAHRRFFANALRWLIRDPELSRVKLSLDASARGVEPGRPVAVEVHSFNARYQPEGGAQVKLTLVPLEETGKSQSLEGVTGDDGVYRTALQPDAAGAFRVQVEAFAQGRSIGTDEDVIVVRAASLEKLYGEARPDVLKALAAAGGGRVVGEADITALPFTDQEVERVHRQRTEPLWNRWQALAVVVLLASLEWWWRRRRGFA